MTENQHSWNAPFRRSCRPPKLPPNDWRTRTGWCARGTRGQAVCRSEVEHLPARTRADHPPTARCPAVRRLPPGPPGGSRRQVPRDGHSVRAPGPARPHRPHQEPMAGIRHLAEPAADRPKAPTAVRWLRRPISTAPSSLPSPTRPPDCPCRPCHGQGPRPGRGHPPSRSPSRLRGAHGTATSSPLPRQGRTARTWSAERCSSYGQQQSELSVPTRAPQEHRWFIPPVGVAPQQAGDTW